MPAQQTMRELLQAALKSGKGYTTTISFTDPETGDAASLAMKQATPLNATFEEEIEAAGAGCSLTVDQELIDPGKVYLPHAKSHEGKGDRSPEVTIAIIKRLYKGS